MTLLRIILFIGLSLSVMTAAAQADGAKVSELTGKTLITGDVVTVGDLFTNAGGSSEHVLAPAPAIGGRLVLSLNDLKRVAKAFRLNWMPKDENGVTLQRDAIAVTNDKIIEALKNSSLKDQVDAGAEFQLSNLKDDIIIPGQTDPELKITDIVFDKQNKKFSAILNVSRDDKNIKQITLEGLAAVMVKIPVLKYGMNYSTTISENDITEITVPETQLRGETIFNKDDLIGMTAKRGLAAGQVLTQQDVTQPVMVHRNDLVTVLYKSGAIQLSSKARSLGNGSRGDSLQFMNTTSKKPFEAKVTGPLTAEVNIDG